MPHTSTRPFQKWLAKHTPYPALGQAKRVRLRDKIPRTSSACRYCGGEVTPLRTGSQARWCSTEHWIEDVNLVL